VRKRAIIYARISKDADRNGLGIERQERECRAICDGHDLDVVAVFVDNDLSAYWGRPRPGYIKTVDMMKANGADVLVSWHADRITRHTRELEDLIDILDATGVEVLTVTAGKYDLHTASGRMAARIVGAVARHESEHKAERQRSKTDELASQGVPYGGRAPFGYRWEFSDQPRNKGRLLIDPAQSQTLRWMAAQALAGQSMAAIARDLNQRGVPTDAGLHWRHSTVRQVLINPAPAGLRIHRGEVAGPGNWEPIFTRPEWEEIKATVADPARKHRRPTRKYLLTGLVQNTEGDPMIGGPDNGGRAYRTHVPYKTFASIDADKLEEHVVEMVLVALDDWRPEQPKVDDTAAAEVARLEAELAELADLRGKQVISMSEWLAARGPLNEALEEARRDAGKPRPMPAMLNAGNIADAWEDADIEQRRQVIATVVDHVEIGKATRGRWTTMDERVRIVWRA
jgi:DNA invertase Pin-like site-specific DNA recombinase